MLEEISKESFEDYTDKVRGAWHEIADPQGIPSYIVKTYVGHAIAYYDGSHYLVSYDTEWNNDEIAKIDFSPQEDWIEVTNVWVAKQVDSIEKSSWKVGVGRGMSIVSRSSWDGAAAKKRIFAWAGWPDSPQPSKARRAFLLYDSSEPENKGSYKDPIADVVDGKLVVISAALSAAASRLPQTSAPPDVIKRAQAALKSYQNRIKKADEEGVEIVEKDWDVSLIEKDEEKQIVYGVVYGEREYPDSQGDLAEMDEVEQMAHAYLIEKIAGQEPAIDLLHEDVLPTHEAIPVESYIAPVDFTSNGHQIRKGDWVLATYIPNTELWEAVKTGEIRAYSIRGYGKRIPVE